MSGHNNSEVQLTQTRRITGTSGYCHYHSVCANIITTKFSHRVLECSLPFTARYSGVCGFCRTAVKPSTDLIARISYKSQEAGGLAEQEFSSLGARLFEKARKDLEKTRTTTRDSRVNYRLNDASHYHLRRRAGSERVIIERNVPPQGSSPSPTTSVSPSRQAATRFHTPVSSPSTPRADRGRRVRFDTVYDPARFVSSREQETAEQFYNLTDDNCRTRLASPRNDQNSPAVQNNQFETEELADLFSSLALLCRNRNSGVSSSSSRPSRSGGKAHGSKVADRDRRSQ